MNKIAKVRKKFGISQAQLYKKIGWRQSRLSNYENNIRQLGVKEAQQITKALKEMGADVSFEELFL